MSCYPFNGELKWCSLSLKQFSMGQQGAQFIPRNYLAMNTVEKQRVFSPTAQVKATTSDI